MADRGLEEPEEDAAEQARSAQPDTEAAAPQAREVPLDVNEADAAEQSRDIEMDEEEYR